MRVSIHFIISSLIIALLLGCGFSTEKRRPKAIEKELQRRDVKILSDAEIMRKASFFGDSVTMVARDFLFNTLKEHVVSGERDSALHFCSTAANSSIDSIGSSFKVHLKKLSLTVNRESNATNSMEKELLEAYAYSIENGSRPSSNLQLYSNKDSILYNKPIYLTDQLCLNCHGASNKLAKSLQDSTLNKYPRQKPTNSEWNGLLGMWSVRLSKKQLIKSF